MKKLISILLVLVMVLSLGTTAFAAAMEGELTNGSITINNAVSGQTYSAYQILYLESYNKDSGAYAYKANSDWADWLKTQTAYVSIDDQGYVTWKDGADVAAFAAAAATQLTGKTAAATETATSTTVTLSPLNLGYYLVDTTLGTLCSLDTTNPTVTMEEKNEEPTHKKEVEEDSNKQYGDTDDADIGQVVNFKTTVVAKKGAQNYVVHDKMSAGLTFNNDVKVWVGETEVAASNYNVVTEGLTDGCTFHVVFDQDYLDSIEEDTTLVITYSATLNENAVIGGNGNPNDSRLEYGEGSFTEWDETITYTWDLKVLKFANGDETKLLAGATFKLCKDEAGEQVIKFHNLGNNKYQVCEDADCTKAHVTEITTDATGAFHIEGLDADTYWLHEVKAPDGYNKLPAPIKVEIVATEGTSDTGSAILTYSTVEKKVENKSGAELPSTGGMGTTMFYVIGGLMAAAAVVLLVTKKRMHDAA